MNKEGITRGLPPYDAFFILRGWSLCFGRIVARADESATDTCHAAEVLILCPYETYQGNDAHEHLLYHHSCLCHNLFIFLLFILCFLNHDAKVRRFCPDSKKLWVRSGDGSDLYKLLIINWEPSFQRGWVLKPEHRLNRLNTSETNKNHLFVSLVFYGLETCVKNAQVHDEGRRLIL